MKRNKLKIRYGGFTLVELLTTLAVIGILLGLLVPALNMVSKTANKVKQKAQFHAIGTALEAFRNDYGDYPPSMWDPNPMDDTDGYVYGYYSASQRLAEALIGQDGFGFHPSSQFRANGSDGTNFLYAPDVDLTANPDNLASRQGPYLELESANAVTLENLYGTGNHGSLENTFILADMYKVAKNKTTAKMTGSPILYYKANRLKT
ncbi:MAG: type II secretion system protein, partial [Planctomycetota bacterium]